MYSPPRALIAAPPGVRSGAAGVVFFAANWPVGFNEIGDYYAVLYWDGWGIGFVLEVVVGILTGRNGQRVVKWEHHYSGCFSTSTLKAS